jgi:hypothetical protein
MVHVGLERFLHHRQREEIRVSLEADHGISLSSGEISVLAARFLRYLERLHCASAPALRAALAADGGWPLHVDASGEDGRGTLLVAFAGWRQWVLGAWKVPTERADAILPRLREVTFRFGPPCAIVRDLGRAMAEASQALLKSLKLSIPVLACHLHFLKDIGKDLLEDSHDRLRVLFRRVRPELPRCAHWLNGFWIIPQTEAATASPSTSPGWIFMIVACKARARLTHSCQILRTIHRSAGLSSGCGGFCGRLGMTFPGSSLSRKR